MTLEVRNSAFGGEEAQGEEREGDVLSICAVSCRRSAVFLQHKDYNCKLKVTLQLKKFT